MMLQMCQMWSVVRNVILQLQKKYIGLKIIEGLLEVIVRNIVLKNRVREGVLSYLM